MIGTAHQILLGLRNERIRWAGHVACMENKMHKGVGRGNLRERKTWKT